MKLFSKDNDYNLILEKILDSKYFSSNTKSLLLSMIYKIEVCYEDYRIVKGIEKTKDEFITELIDIIKKYCDNIKLVEPDSKEAEIIRKNNVQALTNEKERSLLSYPTEIALLYAISDVLPKYFYIPEDFLLKNAFQNTLVNGYNQNNMEILADFNGWSWDINLSLKNNITDFLIYQNIQILFGQEFLEKWLENSSTKENPFNEVKAEFFGTKYFDFLCKYLYETSIDSEKKKIDKIIKAKKEELEKISDRPKYFEEIKSKKMKCLKEVEKLDMLLNNKEKLMKKYIAENLKLEEGKRFATVNAYKKQIQLKRENLMKEITVLSNKIKPVNYMKYKSDLEDAVNLFEIKIGKEECLKNLQIEFVKVLREKIDRLEVEDEIINYIYKVRYYQNLYIDENTKVKDVKELKLEEVWYELINKACEKEILRKVSENPKINFEVLKNVLDTKIINLNDVKFGIAIKNVRLGAKTFEKEEFEKGFVLEFENPKKGILLKQNKIYKLFV